MIIGLITFIIMIVLTLLLFGNLGSLAIDHRRKMEKLNIDHIKDLQKLSAAASQFSGDIEIHVQYLIPHETQMLWTRLRGNIKMRPYTFSYVLTDSPTSRNSHYSITISKKAYFYLKMNNWADTSDRELALKGIKYLGWKGELP